MIASAPQLSFFPPPFQSLGEALGFWSQTPLERQESEASSHPDFPPLKKQRQSDNGDAQFPPNLRNLPSCNPPMIKGISKMFFKTRICDKFRQGTCPYGSSCNFAHGVEEMRKPPPNWKELVAAHEDERGSGNWTEQQRIINRLRICRKFFYGEGCPYGDKCNFVHEDQEKLRESVAVTVCSNGNWADHSEGIGVVNSAHDNKLSDSVVIFVVDNKGSGVANASGDGKSVYWKTKICNKWEVTGQCPFGDNCHFAHGQAELQKFGGGSTENDSGCAAVAPPKPLPSANFISPRKNTVSSCKQPARGIKRFAKLNGTGLISHVYADWIDDVQHLDKSCRLKAEI